VRILVTALVLLAALAAGLYLTAVDARTDDTGILAGLILLAAGALAAARPRAAVLIAALVGLPIPVVEAIRFGSWTALAALGFAFAGAFAGAYIGIVLRRSLSTSA
jgi:hypothetical protein